MDEPSEQNLEMDLCLQHELDEWMPRQEIIWKQK